MADSVVAVKLDKDRRLARRRWASWSFYYVLSFSVLIALSLLFHPARLEISTALATAMPVIGAMLSVFTAIIGLYMGFSAMEKTFGRAREETV